MTSPEQPWYRDGLRFRCTRCGNCCRGAGNVWLGDDDVDRLAGLQQMTPEDFRSAYARRVDGAGLVLRQKRNEDCVFWSETSGCSVYAARPRQCRTYPFWQGVVHLAASWREEARSCPGIDRGDLYPAAEVARTAARDGIPAHRTRTRVARDLPDAAPDGSAG